MKTLTLLFKSLYSNSAVVDGARGKKWWYAVILFLLASIISIIPVVVTTSTVNGGSFLISNVFELDKTLPEFAEFLSDNSLNFTIDSKAGTINNDRAVTIEKWNRAVLNKTAADEVSTTLPAPYTITKDVLVKDDKGNYLTENTKVLQVYNFTDFENEHVGANINHILKSEEYVDKDTWKKDPTVPTISSSDIKRNVSFLVLGKETYALYKFAFKSTTYSATGGDFLNMSQFAKLSDVKTYDEWKTFLEYGYINTKNTNCLVQTSIMAGINCGISLLMGLMFFLLTRGKSNPYRIYTFWECFKISFWAMLTPALLTLILGFFLTQFSTLLYVMFFGVRAMWLSMKQLKPIQ